MTWGRHEKSAAGTGGALLWKLTPNVHSQKPWPVVLIYKIPVHCQRQIYNKQQCLKRCDIFSSFIMHRRIPWTELFSFIITSEASSLTLSEVENIFAAWRLVLKKMYLSRRMICFSGIEVVWSTHTLKRPRRFFSVPVRVSKTKMVRQISVIQNLIWYSTVHVYWTSRKNGDPDLAIYQLGMWCTFCFFFGQVCRRIIGPGGENMKRLEPQISCGLDVRKNFANGNLCVF